MNQQDHILALREEYKNTKRLLYAKLFKAMVTGFMIQPFIELLRALFIGDTWTFSTTLLTSASVLIITRFILKLKDSLELFITIFLGAIQAGYNLIYFNGDSQIYENIYNTYYFGHLNALFEGTISNRIPNFYFRTAFRVVLLLLRFFTIPIVDKGVIPSNILCCVMSVYLDYDKEKHDQNLFGSYFHSREKLNKFKDLVVNDIPEGVVIMTQDLRRCLFANNSFIQLTGETSFSSSEFYSSLAKFKIYEVSSSNSDLATENTEPSTSDAKLNLLSFLQNLSVLRNSKVSCNLSFKISETEESIFEAKVVSLVWDEHLAIGIILHDVTQQNAILRLKIAANQQKDRILATVSHELRTPLNGILGMIQVIQQKVHDSEILQYLSICSNSGYLLLGLVNSILDLNLIRANKLKLYPEKINVSKFLQEIVQLFEYQCKIKSIFLKLKISPIVPKIITTDRNRLSQILINLIGNALKFTSKGGITISVVPSSQNKDFLQISVEDTGVGIRAEERHKLFQIFGKLENDTKENAVNTQGVGLGLTISNNLADLLCNHSTLQGIKLETEYGKGSTFSFLIRKDIENHPQREPTYEDLSIDYINERDISENKILNQFFSMSPLKKPHTSQRSSVLYSPKSQFASSTFKHLDLRMSASDAAVKKPFIRTTSIMSPKEDSQESQILIVDDNPLNIAVAELFVLKNHYQAKTALYGQAAIDIMLNNDHKKNPIKLILMDLQMPMMDGYEATKVLRDLMKKKRVPETPIVALTANDNEDDRKACKEAGMCDYLSKPIKETELIRVLENYCK